MSPAYMHSMTLTDNYIVLIEQPLAVSLSELLSDIVTNAPFISGLKWHNEPVSVQDCFYAVIIPCESWSEIGIILHSHVHEMTA